MSLPSTTLYPQATGLYPEVAADVVPTVTTGAVSDITVVSALVQGTVNPNGLQTHWYVEYGSTGFEFRQRLLTDGNVGTGSSPVAVSMTLALNPISTYFYRIVACNGAGCAYGAAGGPFTTPASLSTVAGFPFVHQAGRGQ